MRGTELLVFVRGETSWGVERAEVRRFGVTGGGITISLRHDRLRADRVVAMLSTPTVRKPGRILRRFWPVSSRGLAVVEGQVVVVIDPLAPPPELALQTEGASDE
ncbi:MAG: hypothetical protein KA072_11805 [Thermoanaerobaculaceae bacterium]|mgnify:CR=1 FL=1|nr:hypothetical protein [Thermoanaerobaculaceae bacterium]MDI9621379.1 hypothetical protein [Acidobacteriota bacterium]NLH10788.1 hypothetical protein [Holophagae bacterium]HPW56277.1 hypothetical protein [Thermoanaerobaculaceae bacterium]